MIQYLPHHAIDRERWDRCVTASDSPLVYAMSWYLDIVAPGWNALVMDDYRSVFPLPYRKKWGLKYVYQPAFTQQLGCFGEGNVDDFLLTIPEEFRLVDLQLNHVNTCHRFKTETRPNLVLSLQLPIEHLRKSYSENVRRNIKKSHSHGLALDESVTIDSIIELFRNHKGKAIRGLKEMDYSTLKLICSEATKRNLLELHAARHPVEGLQAGAVFLRSPHGWIFLFSAVDPAGRSTGAMSALIDRFIERHAGESCVLDFEGSTDPDLYRFYKSFGSRESVYLRIRMNRLPFPLRLFKNQL
ncbi:MAG: GNAT family N-acetyltransferase [Flavobacteriales bacterium]